MSKDNQFNPDVWRDAAVVGVAICVAFSALGAVLFYMNMPRLGAALGIPGWISALALIGFQLRARISASLVIGIGLIADQLLINSPDISSAQRLLLVAMTAAAWAAGWGLRQWRAMVRERHHHAARMQWHESLYNQMLSSSTECVKLIAVDGTLLAINTAGVRLLGADSPAQLIGHNWFDLWGSQARVARAAFAEALATGAAMFEGPAPTLDGDMKLWRNRLSAVQEPGGDRQLLCISADITAASSVDVNAAQQIVQWQQLIDCLPTPAFTLDHDRNITHTNVRARALLQIQADGMDGAALRAQLSPGTVELLEQKINDCRESGTPQHCQFYWPERLAWIGATVLPNDAGATVVLNDLSNALAASPRPLEVEQLRLTQDISNVGDWLFNYREGLLILAERALRVVGLPEKTLLQGVNEGGHKKAVLEVLHPDDRVLLVQSIVQAAKNAEAFQVTVRRLDALAPGGVRYLDWRGRSVTDALDGVPRLIGAVRDTTHERALHNDGERWRRLFADGLDALPVDAYVFNSEGTVVIVNRNYEETLRADPRSQRLGVAKGANVLELFTQSIQRIHDPKAREYAIGNYEGVRAVVRRERTSHQFEYAGAGREFRAHFTAIEGTNLTISAHIDITASKRLNDSLAEHDRRLIQAMNATQDGVWVWAPATGRTFYSAQFGDLMQYPVDALPAFDEMLLTTTHNDDRERVEAQLAEFSPPVDRHAFSLEVRLLVGSANYRWFRLRGEVQRRGSGDVEIVGSIMDIQAERDLQQKILDVAYRDDITHLSNRQAFYQQLDKICEHAEPHFSVLLVDLDRFKNVNSSLGVTIGDELLRQVAARLRRVLGDSGFIARLSGDEFAVVLPEITAREIVEQRVGEIQDAMRPIFQLDGQDMYISASIGIASCPQDGRNREQLLRAVDVALRTAKRSGVRGGHHFFESSLQLPGRERLALENELRMALKRNEFELFYQGKFDLRTDSLIGAEALLRWRSRDRGLVSPGEFIPLLEETGMILQVGEWALRDACRQAIEWHEQTGRWLKIAVNVSTIQMTAREFGETAIAILRESKIPPQTIELEITESALMADIEQGAQLLKILKLAGFSIALDDFGTGYSSLGYLRRFSPHTLKMDRSFIADLEHDTSAREIAAGIVQLARALSIDVVAEGVETTAQRDILRGMRCPIGQGYLFAKPIAVPEFEQRLLALHTPRVVKLDKR